MASWWTNEVQSKWEETAACNPVIKVRRLEKFFNALCQVRKEDYNKGDHACWKNPFRNGMLDLQVSRQTKRTELHVLTEVFGMLDRSGIDRRVLKYWLVTGRIPERIRRIVAQHRERAAANSNH